jgi:hypothetical protein
VTLMDNREASLLLTAALARYRGLTYSDLRPRIGEVICDEVAGASGTKYQIEINFDWDDRPSGDIRVMGGIDDGGWSAFLPLCDSFIMAPDGRFVGEGAS